MGRPSSARRKAARALERATIAEYKAACAAAGWIRRHSRPPFTGNLLELNGELSMLSGFNINPPGLRVTRGGKVALLPVETWATMRYDVLAGCWRVPAAGASSTR